VRVLRATYAGRRGGGREARKRYAELRDRREIARRRPAFPDEGPAMSSGG